MGADIVSFVEVKKKEYKWQCEGGQDNSFASFGYNLYAFLAGVRNKYYQCVHISEPRGIPNDVSGVVRRYHRLWGNGSESPSYLTLKELLDFDYSKTFLEGGDVNCEISYRDF